MLFAAVMVAGASMLAVMQFSEQLERVLSDKPAQAAAVQPPQSYLPLKPLSATHEISEASQIDPKLQAVLDEWAVRHENQDWSIVVQGLNGDNRRATTRAASWYQPASVYKLMMTYSLFSRYNLSDLDKVYVRVGRDSVSLKTCADVMLRYSDNNCGEAIGKHLGWWRVESDLQKAGFKNTFVNRKDSMFSTAADASSFMARLFEGKLMGDNERNWIIKVLGEQRQRGGIPTGCRGCAVANKPGDLGNVRHDVAVVQSGGRTYVLAIFTSGAPYAKIAEITAKINAQMTGAL